MDQELKEYIQSLIPKGFPDGNELVKEGREMAKDINWNKSRFMKEYGYDTHLEYRKDVLSKGKQVYQLLVGLSTLEEEIDAIIEDVKNNKIHDLVLAYYVSTSFFYKSDIHELAYTTKATAYT